MAAQADLIVVLDGGGQIFRVADTDVVGMGIVAHPAAEFFVVFREMDALLVFRINAFEIELCKIFIPPVAIQAGAHRFEPQLVGMREFLIIGRMTVGAVETAVI
jgi:hypothetical protein